MRGEGEEQTPENAGGSSALGKGGVTAPLPPLTEKIQLEYTLSDKDREGDNAETGRTQQQQLEAVMFPVHVQTFSAGGLLMMSPTGPIPELEFPRVTSGGLEASLLGSPASRGRVSVEDPRRLSVTSAVSSVFPSAWNVQSAHPHSAEGHQAYAGRSLSFAVSRSEGRTSFVSVAATATAAGDVPSGSLFASIFNSVNVLVGVGLLSFPYCARLCGWVPSLALLCFFSVTTCWTGMILKECVDVDKKRFVGFPEMAEAAFGRPLRIVIFWMFSLELCTLAGMYLILMVDTLEALVPSVSADRVGKFSAFFIVAAGVTPTLWIQELSLLAPLALMGIGSMVYLIVAMGVYGAVAEGKEGVGGSFVHPASTEMFGPWKNLPIGVGLIAVGFSGHSCFPLIYSSLGRASKWKTSVSGAYMVTVSMYGGIMVLGYLMFGNRTDCEISRNLAELHNFAFSIGLVLLVLNPFGKIALTFAPVAVGIEASYLHKVEPRWRGVAKACLRTCLTFGVAAVVAVVPSFEQVTAFIGALFTIPISLTLPCAIYLKFFGHRIGLAKKSVLVGLAVLSLVLVPVGLVGVIALEGMKGN
uniref:Amino acid transporter transmembrane domain-containing protein n=1 Tax=Chromera velia CCMP2878 TaxID=1169474 RepID=A0A0G4G815_9ALVE|eukprot:Cvel_20672.t1-p1 / transcript=Cvel_20672.t1 / gene=Cvel_20672 / organism=Chromera_velia_CCMP2878 / gene_product=Vacuolar amino acid transporter 1, putative / transcript_product=Vacuolar amino acid transporter 1, putative / location=Cvel_scaffold1878:6243-11851(+) / protein_length=584 / sequence_SO=supercontig / SO=protein_coding / is_pseudo=false